MYQGQFKIIKPAVQFGVLEEAKAPGGDPYKEQAHHLHANS